MRWTPFLSDSRFEYLSRRGIGIRPNGIIGPAAWDRPFLLRLLVRRSTTYV